MVGGMTDMLSDLSNTLAAAVERGANAIVQVAGARKAYAGVVFADELVVTAARALGDETVAVRRANGDMVEGLALGHAIGSGLGVVRAAGLGVTPADVGAEPRVGALVIAVGRTWSGNVMASVTNVAVVGGPLRTGRASEIARVIRIAQPPHAALTGGALVDGAGTVLGVISGAAIRGTTVVVPATLAWDAAHQIVKRGGTRQGFLGISTVPVTLPARQHSDGLASGLLITGVAHSSPAESAGLLVGDVLTRVAGEVVTEPESLLLVLRGTDIGRPVAAAVVRGLERLELNVTIGERPARRRA
jgi:S1-C subfamily serine protease